jgi:hypothetical protein
VNAVVDLVFPFPSAHRVKSAHQVGDLSPKGRVGDSRLAPVYGGKLKTNSVQHNDKTNRCDVSAKRRLPIKSKEKYESKN